MKYIDIHSHLYLPEFDADREAVMARLAETETGTIVVGTDLESSAQGVDLAGRHPNVWACIGIHPIDDNPPSPPYVKGGMNPPPLSVRGGEGELFKEFESLIQNPKVVAIGECGLDFFRIEKTEAEVMRQKKLFLMQIEFALEHDKPIMIHSRDAYLELLEILEPLKKEHGEKLRGDIHFFAGNIEQAQRFWDIGFMTSFTGVITFARNYDEVIKNAPLEMLMSETDAPYVAPVPYRGKRNEPSYVSEVVKKIAEIRGEELEVVEKALVANAARFFKLDIA